MIGNTHSIRFVFLTSVVLSLSAASIAHAAQNAVAHPSLIEVFTTSDLTITGEAINRQPGYPVIKLQTYALDGIQQFETNLSQNLTADPEQAKRLVLRRIQQLDTLARARMQRAAMGLAKAMQYGIDRYPVIVFDGEVAVYGVIDIHEAIRRYRQWRKGMRP